MTRHQAVLRSFGSKLSLGALCAVTGGAAILESWSMLLAGMAVLAALVMWDARASRRRASMNPPRIPDGASFKNGAVRGAVEAIAAAQKERLDAVAACPDDAVSMLSDLLRTASEIELAALGIARRAERLHGYLSTRDIGYVRSTLHAAQQSAERARTPAERESYEAAARAYEVELETLGGIEHGIRASLAKLEHIRATLEAVPPRIIKLQATTADLSDAVHQRLPEDLRRVGGELDEVEQHLRALAQSGDAGAEIEYRRIAAMAGDIRVAAVGQEALVELAEAEEAAARQAWSQLRS